MAGAGVEPHDVNELLKQLDAMAQVMISMEGKGMCVRIKVVRELQSVMMNNPNGSAGKNRYGQAPLVSGKAKLKKQRKRELRRRKREKKRGASG